MLQKHIGQTPGYCQKLLKITATRRELCEFFASFAVNGFRMRKITVPLSTSPRQRLNIIWILLFLGCHSNSETKNHLPENSITDTVSAPALDKKDSETKPATKLFNNKAPFEIISFRNIIKKQSTDQDTTKCNRWTLGKPEIERIIRNSEPLDGTTGDLAFLHLPCTKAIHLVQAGQDFEVELNAGSFFWVNNGDTTVLYGDFRKSDRKYFIEGPNIE
jgi:hypothetical protein